MHKLMLAAALGLATAISSAANAAPILWVCDDQGMIGKVDVADGGVTVVGSAGVTLTDIAFDAGGNLYGISFTNLYSINQATGAATQIGGALGSSLNALTFSTTGVAYAMGPNGTGLYTINTVTGAATLIGDAGSSSSGDLAFHNGSLYLTSTANQLVNVGLSPVGGTVVGPLGQSNVYGLANGDDNILYATAGTNVYTVNTATGALTFASSYGGQGLGAANGAAFYSEAVVPEPGSLSLLAGGLGGLFLYARKRRA